MLEPLFRYLLINGPAVYLIYVTGYVTGVYYIYPLSVTRQIRVSRDMSHRLRPRLLLPANVTPFLGVSRDTCQKTVT